MKLMHERLIEVLDYSTATGEFRWKLETSRRGVRRTGTVAGCLRPDGYLTIGVDGISYLAHRLAWFWVYGAWPMDEIDHKNRVKTDNRIVNIREATRSENLQNARKAVSTTGVRGVTWCKRERLFLAYIKLNGRRKNVGYFRTARDAESAYIEAKKILHPFAYFENESAS